MGKGRWSGVVGAIMLCGVVLSGLGACTAPDQPQSAASQPRRSAGTSAGCPPVRSYSDDFRRRAVAEMDLLPANSAVEEMLTDYAVLRQQILGCRQ